VSGTEIDFPDPCDPLGRVKPSQWLRAKMRNRVHGANVAS